MYPLKDTLLHLSDNHYLREHYLENNEAPTQSMMKKKMSPALAEICFKSLSTKLKVRAGLEPPMKGGGKEWYMPPRDLLAGRAVLKPVNPDHLRHMTCHGITLFGDDLQRRYYNGFRKEAELAMQRKQEYWSSEIQKSNDECYKEFSREHSRDNTEKIRLALKQFEDMYKTSVNNIEDMLFEAAHTEIERCREDAYQYMKERQPQLVKLQSINMYDEYEENLKKEKERMKAEFIAEVENIWSDANNKVHDANVDKHLTVEKLRHFLECQNLASQIYVALKERELCEKEMDESKHQHRKKVKHLEEDITCKSKAIKGEKVQKAACDKVTQIWKQKVCCAVKKFQMFVEYCLKTLPQYAEFFLNMEKLMLLQLSEVFEDPSADSIIECCEEPTYNGPVPKPRPFYLVCDKSYRPRLEEKLCLKDSTSDTSHFPVIVIDKKYFYSACDNFNKFAEKVAPYIEGNAGEDADLQDDRDYNLDLPVKMTSTLQLQELKLESSILQIIQQEFPNVLELPVACPVCRIPYCFCVPSPHSKMTATNNAKDTTQNIELRVKPSGEGKLTKEAILRFHREPKMKSYMDYVLTKKCKCVNTARRHLNEHMPAYMKNMSPYEEPTVPNYKLCDVETLKALVRKAKSRHNPPPPPPEGDSQKKTFQDASTQFTDIEFEMVCKCLSCDMEHKFSTRSDVVVEPSIAAKVVGSSASSSFLENTASNFATKQAHTLKRLVNNDPDIQELFSRSKCDFY